MLSTIDVLEVIVTNESVDNILEYVIKKLEKRHEKFYIVTPNPEIIVYAQSHPEYKRVLNEAKIALPDGIGLLFASKLLGKNLGGRFTGVDFIEKFCLECKDKPVSMGFLGGRNKV